MTLIAKGYEVEFKLVGERNHVKPPKSYAMLHDPSGEFWPPCSVLVAPFQRERGTLEDPDAQKYFGYVPREGVIHPPSRNLKNWHFVGDVDEIDYWRPGDHKGAWWHPFSEGGWLFKPAKPTLYKLARMYRLELGHGCTLNHRGFVSP
jgi:hypothetical protein